MDEVVNYTSDSLKTTFFKVLPVDLIVGDKVKRISCLMDSASSVTLLEKGLADELDLHGVASPMALSWADGGIKDVRMTAKVSFKLRNPLTGQVHDASANTYENIRLPASRVTESLLVEEGLAHLPIAHDKTASMTSPALLIGQDNGRLMRVIASWEGRSGSVIASETPLGYALEGETRSPEIVLVINRAADQEMEKLLVDHINEEKFGLQDDLQVRYQSDEDHRATSIMNASTHRRPDHHFETALLWRHDQVCLPNNRTAVRDRHIKWEKALFKDSKRHQNVSELMKKYLEKGYIRPAVEATATPGRTWYLPIFTVKNPMKPEKTRVVWDCAAHYDGTSLNSALVSGPDLTEPLVNVLMRFRTREFAVTGDIEEMFHQIFVREEDRCAQRFFWRNSLSEDLQVMEMCVLSFGATCSPTLAQFAKNLNAMQHEGEHPRVIQAVLKDHYVDDYLDCDADEATLLARAERVRDVHRDGGLKLHKFQSNSKAVLRGLGTYEEADEKVSLSVSSILGLFWNTSDDLLSFRFSRDRFCPSLMDGSTAPTKREMLRVVMSIFDPLGLVSFLTMEGKIVLREAWRIEGKWDDPLEGGIQRRWANWTRHLATIEDVSIPRWHGTEPGPVELHVFTDASENAICATCYVVQENNELRRSSLCLAKCLLAPIKTKSIPRLELDAAVLGVRVANIVRDANAWPDCRVHFWTDAKDVIYWLRSPHRRYSPYVANRVANILSNTELTQWGWVPTDQNPADWGTKWMVTHGPTELWWRGPGFLLEQQDLWPSFEMGDRELLEVRPLLMTQARSLRPCLVPEVERFSDWGKYVETCAVALKFIRILRKTVYPGPITEEERRLATAEIFLEAQRGLTERVDQKRFLLSLAPFFDSDGLLRMRGRIARAESLSYDARFPVILIGDHPIVRLLVMTYHVRNNHQNTSALVNELRQRVTFFNMQAVVRRIISTCGRCSLRRARPVLPQMGALPVDRMAIFQPPFSFVGLDYFGPIEVAIGRRHEKRWVALFTCLTTRAVYLELVTSLSSNSCMAALDSLATRRGIPRRIHSDNATCFVAAAKEYRGPNGARVEWRFIPPNSPSMGGAWERLVGAVKSALSNMDLSRTPTEETLRRALLQAERLVNSRPLTQIPVDPEEEESLTPNHFLLGSSSGIKPEATRDDVLLPDNYKNWQAIVASFWQRFVREYLPSISMRAKWFKKVRPLQEGDLVFICDQDHRGGWKRGRITKVATDSESGQVRDVVVETGDGRSFRRGACSVAPILRNEDLLVEDRKSLPIQNEEKQ